MNSQANGVLHRYARLQIMRELALLNTQQETFYDHITKLATAFITAPVSLVTMVTENYQFFKSVVGLPEPWASDRRTPLSHSFCQHVVNDNTPLMIEDARIIPRLADNLAIPDLNVIAYLGMPLTLRDGVSLGSFCVIDNQPRRWNSTEIAIVSVLAEMITAEIDLRADVMREVKKPSCLLALHTNVMALLDSVKNNISPNETLAQLRAIQHVSFV